MNIIVGQTQKGDLKLDIDVLLRTRMLIQANSGGGKSFLMRRLAEQLFGKVQVIIIDPEGEFPTLREKFGYVLVGQGGETSADVRSAGLVAEKLLELNASAVCDIFESFRKNPQGRHAWVKAFCNALLDAPKRLWHPAVIIIDEVHKFAPEKGAGESEASESVIGLATAGRKRGFCLVGATQRLGKVRKDMTAEMLNRLVGPTFEDLDLVRAADLLSVAPEDKKEFFAQMRMLEPGSFFALGRALCKERMLVKIGPVQTTHPEMGSATYASAPPPTPDKVKALLPKLADLPQQAEEKQRTVEGLQKEVRELKMKLRETSKVPPADNQVNQIEFDRYRRKMEKELEDRFQLIDKILGPIRRQAPSIIQSLKAIIEFKLPEIPKLKQALMTVPAKIASPDVRKTIDDSEARRLAGLEELVEMSLGACERAILGFLSVNRERAWSMEQVGIMTGYSPTSGGFNNAVSILKTRGMISRNNRMLQHIGGDVAGAGNQEFSIDNIKRKLGKCELEILNVILGDPDRIWTKEMVAESTPSKYSPTSGGFGNSISKLTTLGLIARRNGEIALTDDAKELI